MNYRNPFHAVVDKNALLISLYPLFPHFPALTDSTMASSALNSSAFSLQSFSKFPSPVVLSFTHSLTPFLPNSKPATLQKSHGCLAATVKAQTVDFGGSFYEGGFGSDEDSISSGGSAVATVEEKETPQCPPGLRQYESMTVLRPDMSEDERLTLTQKYEELLVAGGGMYVEVFNRGVIPLAYSIKKRNKAGETNNYLDGIYLLFSYFTKPESMRVLEATLQTDDDVIRASTFKIRKRKY